MVKLVSFFNTDEDNTICQKRWQKYLKTQYSSADVVLVESFIEYFRKFISEIVDVETFDFGLHTAVLLSEIKSDPTAIMVSIVLPSYLHDDSSA